MLLLRIYTHRAIVFFVAFLTISPVSAAPCDARAHRQFDFWLGVWNVHTPDGKLAGTNRIESEYEGCVLHERYDTGRGYRGESLNIYDAQRKVWHQTWVDTSGLLLLMEGGLRDGSIVLEGETLGTDGSTSKHRITWTPNPDGSVRQLWESTNSKVNGAWPSMANTLVNSCVELRPNPAVNSDARVCGYIHYRRPGLRAGYLVR